MITTTILFPVSKRWDGSQWKVEGGEVRKVRRIRVKKRSIILWVSMSLILWQSMRSKTYAFEQLETPYTLKNSSENQGNQSFLGCWSFFLVVGVFSRFLEFFPVVCKILSQAGPATPNIGRITESLFHVGQVHSAAVEWIIRKSWLASSESLSLDGWYHSELSWRICITFFVLLGYFAFFLCCYFVFWDFLHFFCVAILHFGFSAICISLLYLLNFPFIELIYTFITMNDSACWTQQ